MKMEWIIIAVCILGGLYSTKYLGNDNPIEQVAEVVIDAETGLDVDLSPSE